MNDIFKELNMNTRDEVVVFLKRLWTNKETLCPKCGNKLEYLHKKAKKSNCDYKCMKCNTIYRTINILNKINEKDKN